MKRRSLLALAGVTLMASTALPVSPARAAATYQVEVGEFPKGAPSEAMAFFPGSIEVHQGDTLRFTNEIGSIPETGIHTATLLPEGMDPETFRREDGLNLDGEWAFFRSDPDEDAGEFPTAVKGNWKVILPSDLTCGAEGSECVYDGSSYVNSGVGNPLDFRVRLDAEPGSVLWALCAIHPFMELKVDVVDAEEPVADQSTIDAANEAQLARDTARAAALHRKLSRKPAYTSAPSGRRVWDASTGMEDDRLTLIGMYPKEIVIRRGDAVRWQFDHVHFEIHTVTFPLAEALDINNAPWAALWCDLDTDAGSAPDQPPLPVAGLCPAPPSDVWELDIDARFAFPMGDGSITSGSDVASSGIGGYYPGIDDKPFHGDGPFELTFTNSGTYEYACALHPTMRGKIVVR